MNVIAKRADGQPAYVAAKPRKRQSDYAKPFALEPMPAPSIWRRIFKGGVK